ncbi:hypothetical protein J7J18_04625 [bacterium]|nr:hypothetical protein [bacterium]
MIKNEKKRRGAEGIEAIASGKWHPVLTRNEKEVYGIIDGHKVILTWNIKGKNPKWKEEAVKRYREYEKKKRKKSK